MSSEKKTSSMSPEERNRRREAVGKAASEKVAKSEQLNFRLEEQSISELQQLAFDRGMPVGTMIREWVLERMTQEKTGNPDAAGKALRVLDEFHTRLNYLFEKDNSSTDLGLIISEGRPSASQLQYTWQPTLEVGAREELDHLSALERFITGQLRAIHLRKAEVEKNSTKP